MTLPSEFSEFSGRRLLRVFTSHDRQKIGFEFEQQSTTSRYRYMFAIDGTIDAVESLTSILGHTISSCVGLDPEETTQQNKFVIYSNNGLQWAVFYLTPPLSDDEVTLTYTTEDRKLAPYGASEQYIVQEDDFDYGVAVVCGWVPIETIFTVNFEHGLAIVSNGPTMTDSVVTGTDVVNNGQAESGFLVSCEGVTGPTYIRATVQSYSANIPLPNVQVFPANISIERGDGEFVELENENDADGNGDVSSFTPTTLTGVIDVPEDEEFAGVNFVALSSVDQEEPPENAENTESYEVFIEVYVCNGVPGVPPE